MRGLCIAIYGMLFIGCAAQAPERDTDAELRIWIGRTETELVDFWGAPNSVYKLADSGALYTYYQSGGRYLIPTGYGSYTRYTMPGALREFRLDSAHIVRNYRFEDPPQQGRFCFGFF